MSANYDYVINTVKNIYPGSKPVCLDFGCGGGQIVERGLSAGLDFHGADPYPENRSTHYENEAGKNTILGGHIHKIEKGKIPFPDDHFDFVSSNVVLEHVADLPQALSEIRRVLKPNGYFLALFPTKDVWWEGHAKLYFIHWLNPMSKTAHFYLKAAKTLGLGNKTDKDTPDEWATHYQHYLQEYCFYRPMSEIRKLWLENFGCTPESYAYDYMMFRLSQKQSAKKIVRFMNNTPSRFLLEQICHIRAGRVILTRNRKNKI